MHRSRIVAAILALFALSPLSMFSQTPEQLAAARKSLEDWRMSRADMLRNDFGELARYRDANAALKPPAPGEKRVVFYGDSITDAWHLDQSFPGKPYVNRGIGGQTTAQMLIRLRPDVIDLHPSVVVILAGTNDIAGNTGPMSLEDIEHNYASMAELARANNIKVIYSSVLPIHNYTPRSLNFFFQRSPEKILELNRWLRDYCATGACFYLDYFSSVVDEHGMLRKELAEDGLHPNAEGYRIMAEKVEAAIKKAFAP